MICDKKSSSTALGLAILLSGCPVACSAQKLPTSGAAVSYRYDTAGIRLKGTLIERKEYGPPGYGETPSKDERDTILVLKLSSPISVQPTENAKANGSASLDSVQDIHEVQLFIPKPRAADVRKLLGKTVVAVGRLNEAAAPSQYTKVWLDAQTVDVK